MSRVRCPFSLRLRTDTLDTGAGHHRTILHARNNQVVKVVAKPVKKVLRGEDLGK